MTGGLAVILGGTGRNLGAGMSGGTAYVYDLKRERVNRDALATGELELLPLDSADREISATCWSGTSRDRIRPRRRGCSRTSTTTVAKFVKVLPRDYAAVLQTRPEAVDEGLDPDGDVVWNRILEVTGG